MRDFFKYFLASVLGFVVGTIVLFFLFLGIVSLLVSSLQSDTEVTVRISRLSKSDSSIP